MKKYKDTVNEAILLAVNNVPPVHGTSVFFINRIKNANKNKIALILAACALISCQDIIVYIYEEFFAEIKFCRIKFEKKVGLLQMVSNWSEQNLTRNAADFSTFFKTVCETISEMLGHIALKISPIMSFSRGIDSIFFDFFVLDIRSMERMLNIDCYVG